VNKKRTMHVHPAPYGMHVHTFFIDPLHHWKDVACVSIASEDETRRTGYPVLVLIYSIPSHRTSGMEIVPVP